MKQVGFIIGIFWAYWLSAITPVSAQENPFHCDTLKAICFDETKIKIRYFDAPKTCPYACLFCAEVAKADWLAVNKQLQTEAKNLRGTAAPLETLQTWLLAHRLVNFVLPPKPETLNQPKTSLQIGFQVPHMTYTWDATFERKKARKAKPAYWKLTGFQSDSEIYSRLNALAADFQKLVRSDSLHLPKPLMADHNYLASWFGTRRFTPPEYAKLETQIRNNPRAVVKTFIEQKDGFGLVMLMAHENLAVRYLALQGIKKLQDKNCLQYLLRLAEYTRHPAETNPETNIFYLNYLEQLISTIGTFTNCSFNRCPYAHYQPQHYLQLGLPAWEKRLEPMGGQGIGSYGIEL